MDESGKREREWVQVQRKEDGSGLQVQQEEEAGGSQGQREREARVSLLALRYRSGDRAALGLLYAELEPFIQGILRRHLSGHRSLPPAMEPEDLLQQSYLELAETVLEWEPDRRDNFMPYLLRSFPWRVDRYLRSQTPRRRSARFQLYSVPHDLLMERMADAPGLDGREWDDALVCGELLQGMPVLYSRVVRLHLYQGLPFAEVAERLGISRSAAHEDFGRAIAMAKKALAGSQIEPEGRRVEPASCRQDGLDPTLLRRCVELLHRMAPGGEPLPGREQLRREAGLTWSEYREIMSRLRARGCLVGRRRGSGGSLTCASPTETMRRLRGS